MAIDLDFRTQFAVGHVASFTQKGASGPSYIWQNFFVDGPINYGGTSVNYTPFMFSGVTVNRNGDNQTTTLVTHNNALARNIGIRMVSETWFCKVDTLLLNPDNSNDQYQLTTYTGMLINATVSGPTIEIEIGSILDAVGNDVPRRRITEDIFGPLPTTANVRLQ